MIIIVLTKRKCHTILILLRCNTICTMIAFSIFSLTTAIFGIYDEFFDFQPACKFRGYYFAVTTTALCYSYAVQAVSRLFYTVLYRFKFLTTWKAHWYLIFINWFISFLIHVIIYLLDNDFFVYERESRWCVATTKKPITAVFFVLIALMVPVTAMLTIYGVIFSRIRQSTLRVQAFTISQTMNKIHNLISPLNIKRELAVMKSMIIIICLMFCGGILYLLLLVWNLIDLLAPPESLYLLGLNICATNITVLTVITVYQTKEVKRVIVDGFHRWRLPRHR